MVAPLQRGRLGHRHFFGHGRTETCLLKSRLAACERRGKKQSPREKSVFQQV